MVDIASIFGIAFLVVSLLMTIGLTWLGVAEGEFSAVDGEESESTGT